MKHANQILLLGS